MKISNELKVGALTVIAVTLLILGYNLLKGTNLIKRSDVIYIRFPDAGSLEISSPVKIKGFKVGNVTGISASDVNVTEVIVAVNLDQPVNIPVNSLASISSSLTATAALTIAMGNAGTYVKRGDTLNSINNPDLLTKLGNNLDPLLSNVQHAVDSLKILLGNINSTLDGPTKANLKQTMANLTTSSASLATLLNTQNGALAKTLSNAEQFTTNLNKNNESLNASIDNIKNTTQQLSEAQLKETVANLNTTISQLQSVLEKANTGNGSLGLLLNDPKLYNNLQHTSRSLNVLLDDFKTHPKRYVSFSVFGKKDKTKPLMAPLADSAGQK